MTNTCAKCGHTGPFDDFIKPRAQRRPCCRKCDSAAQKEWRYRRRGKRREVGVDVESFRCDRCHLTIERLVTMGPPKRRCDPCLRDAYNERARLKQRRVDLKRHFGITPETYADMLAAQRGKCAACRVAETASSKDAHLAVDHCHATGEVRGLLCGHCNLALGYLKDDPERIVGLYTYLTRWIESRQAA